MNKLQSAHALENMINWLQHPSELGKKPGKIEITFDFELDNMTYYVFKYKKSLLGKWLIGVCGGYENDELENCGHVFSEMQPYNEQSAKEDAIKLVYDVRYFGKKMAKELVNKGDGGTLVSSVLWDDKKMDFGEFASNMKKMWNLNIDLDGVKDNTYILVNDDVLATVTLIPSPVPKGEAEYYAKTNFYWPEAEETVKKHKAHLLVAVVAKKNLVSSSVFFVKLCAALAKSSHCLGIYSSGTVHHPEMYCDFAKGASEENFPTVNLIYFGVVKNEKTFSCYTYGLNAFNKLELEVVKSDKSVEDLREFIYNIATYIIKGNVTLKHGETIGYTETQKLPITVSKGVNLPDVTIKIEY